MHKCKKIKITFKDFVISCSDCFSHWLYCCRKDNDEY